MNFLYDLNTNVPVGIFGMVACIKIRGANASFIIFIFYCSCAQCLTDVTTNLEHIRTHCQYGAGLQCTHYIQLVIKLYKKNPHPFVNIYNI
jgi:hypothetical protein